jgi:hypothetical protein
MWHRLNCVGLVACLKPLQRSEGSFALRTEQLSRREGRESQSGNGGTLGYSSGVLQGAQSARSPYPPSSPKRTPHASIANTESQQPDREYIEETPFTLLTARKSN